MDDQDPSGRVTRLGPESGGRLPSEPTVAYRSWSWSSDDPSGRRGLPIVGVFIVGFGLLLLLQQAVPGTSFWAWLALAAGGVSLVAGWRRGSATLVQLGVLCVAVGLPSLLTALGIISGPGWGTVFLGVALVGIGLARHRDRIGWQVVLGAILVLVGVSQRFLPDLDQLVLPLAIVVVGGVVVARAMAARPIR